MPESGEQTDAVLAAARALVAMAVRTVDEGPYPVTVAQHRVLLLLDEAGSLSVGDVAAGLKVDQSNASRHCSRLVELGLVGRTQASHDRRSVDMRLTPMGRRQVDAVRAARTRWADTVLERLSERDAAAALRGLRVFADAAHEQMDIDAHVL